jgi:hypothetical protein
VDALAAATAAWLRLIRGHRNLGSQVRSFRTGWRGSRFLAVAGRRTRFGIQAAGGNVAIVRAPAGSVISGGGLLIGCGLGRGFADLVAFAPSAGTLLAAVVGTRFIAVRTVFIAAGTGFAAVFTGIAGGAGIRGRIFRDIPALIVARAAAGGEVFGRLGRVPGLIGRKHLHIHAGLALDFG